ncbi:hypothetical protein [Streptococcus equi]|uniref:hypothetical protein n=1 Tax=Streptococcus equi TaxID=1336 RepID=UPI001E2B2912|nr:hypothetical protein [Streptococcus equi]
MSKELKAIKAQVKVRLIELDMTDKIISNWQKKNHQLSQLMIDSLEGLDIWETILALGRIRSEY